MANRLPLAQVALSLIWKPWSQLSSKWKTVRSLNSHGDLWYPHITPWVFGAWSTAWRQPSIQGLQFSLCLPLAKAGTIDSFHQIPAPMLLYRGALQEPCALLITQKFYKQFTRFWALRKNLLLFNRQVKLCPCVLLEFPCFLKQHPLKISWRDLLLTETFLFISTG